MDAWERWRIVCLAALSVEDIEDIYLFGTMITGILLIGLGFALGYRRIKKTGTAVQSLTRLPVWLKQWEEWSALRLRLLIAIWILSWRSSRLCRGKLILEIRMDKESSRGIGMRLLALRQNNPSYLFCPPPRTVASVKVCCWKITLGRALQWDALASSPILQTLIINYYTHTHTHMHSLPLPDPSPPSLLNHQPDRRVCGQRREWLRDRMAACWSWITSPVAKSCVYGLCAFCCWGVFPVLTLYSPRSIVWGLFFSPLLSFLMLCCIFLQFPVFLSCLPPCICMLCMYGQVDG